MDLNMPVMGGAEASSKIRDYESENNIEPRVCIIGVTGEVINSKFLKSHSYD